MKKKILIYVFCFLFPMSLLAQGETLVIFIIMALVFIYSIIVGLVEYYLIKQRFELNHKGMFKIFFLNLSISTILFY